MHDSGDYTMLSGSRNAMRTVPITVDYFVVAAILNFKMKMVLTLKTILLPILVSENMMGIYSNQYTSLRHRNRGKK